MVDWRFRQKYSKYSLHQKFAIRYVLNAAVLALSLFFGSMFFQSRHTVRAEQKAADPTAAQTQTPAPSAPGKTASPVPAQSPSLPTQPTNQPGENDVAGRSKAILLHLNAVLRFYHDSEAPIQKVGEPSDLIYRDQAVTLAAQVAGFAFQSAKAEAAIMARTSGGQSDTPAPESQAQRLQTMRDSVAQRIAALKAQSADLDKQLQTARARDIAGLRQQREEVAGELELQSAMEDALAKITGISVTSNDTGFAAQVGQLERSAPGLTAGKSTSVAPTLENLSAARSAGVSSQAIVLFHLLAARQSIDNLAREANSVHQQALELRTPLSNVLRRTISQGEALSQQIAATPLPAAPATHPAATHPGGSAAGAAAPAANPAPTLAETRKTFDQLTLTFKGISAAAVPLSQEIVTLEQSGASLQAWRRAVDEEYKSILSSLLFRVAGIAVALAIIFALGEVWRRATTRYVQDVRRRRQLLLVRRLIIGFLSGLVMIFGVVTQFSSLATFAGFITAGLAVGLQTILLSVAAYFFIIGRYGVRVGDRITIATVTGDVAEVGLVRFYVLELAGSGTDLYPTGRVAVFSNAVLFQAGTPLFKQLPGTEYIWHELTVKLAADGDYRPAVEKIQKSVQDVYDSYRQEIEKQHRNLESWMDSSMDAPGIQSNLQLVDGGLQLWLRFPVIIRQAASIDGHMTEALLRLIGGDPQVKAAVSAPPIIKAAVKG
ncbi:MscS family mechanosensitive ion channel [Acidisarcina polymorpha]|uniref:MscS family mechanosensitive ion channel n=1 Tax=Acidisarcina polymorpha TaxID=2211140 RepID=A0A2Z5G6I3_9BACT|nr:mechanosensitive ion channel domain-containing protein [Acidisarcina polymorpha]AXC14245.1 MscS family mechanosensitive ion channel [Acidisarcina polymorpha]